MALIIPAGILPYFAVRWIVKRNPWLLGENSWLRRSNTLDLKLFTLEVEGSVTLEPHTRERLQKELRGSQK